MENCIFCKIVEGKMPSYTIYEDDIAKVFLNIDPATNGHLLIVPKKHYVNVLDIDNDTLCHIQLLVKKIYPIIKEKLNCDGLTLSQNNEYSQEVLHYHLHLTPRYKNDGCKITYDKSDLKTVEEIYNILKEEHI